MAAAQGHDDYSRNRDDIATGKRPVNEEEDKEESEREVDSE